MQWVIVAALLVGGWAGRLVAQEVPAAEHRHPDTAAPAWTWVADGNAFFGYNYQRRHFADDSVWESQNWFGIQASHARAARRVTMDAMFSLEPFTMQARGSPQLFQTGESYHRIPLVNFQHPHDLFMALGVTYRVTRARVVYAVGADLVGSPTLGPMPFMHRPSARDNPQVPLIHHYLDATHSTPGVLRAAVRRGPVTIEGSAFRGAGPDENRLNIERPRLDSWALRGNWDRGSWHLQMSGGRLKQPEWFEPYDATRLTASIAFDGQLRSHPLGATLAWGENRQFNGFNGNADAFLLEWGLRATDASTTYGRVEAGAKELFGLGPHPRQFAHPHWFSDVRAFTFGYCRDVEVPRVGRIGAGADATLYRMPPDLAPYYASSRGFHVFMRWRPAAAAMHVH